jgi:hypothetical protein
LDNSGCEQASRRQLLERRTRSRDLDVGSEQEGTEGGRRICAGSTRDSRADRSCRCRIGLGVISGDDVPPREKDQPTDGTLNPRPRVRATGSSQRAAERTDSRAVGPCSGTPDEKKGRMRQRIDGRATTQSRAARGSDVARSVGDGSRCQVEVTLPPMWQAAAASMSPVGGVTRLRVDRSFT